MKAVYVFGLIFVVYAVSTTAYKKKNGFPAERNKKSLFPKLFERVQKKEEKKIEKRKECQDEWYSVVCKAAKYFGKCNSKVAKDNCAKSCGHCHPCDDIWPLPKCLYKKETHMCHEDEARANCGTTCESCGKACKNYIKQCNETEILEELCTIKSGGFMLCPRGCNLCVDRE